MCIIQIEPYFFGIDMLEIKPGYAGSRLRCQQLLLMPVDHGCRSGNAWPDRQNLALISRESSAKLRKIGPWTHQAHLATQHIDELRQLVELPVPQQTSDREDPAIACASNAGAGTLWRSEHGTKLHQFKQPAIFSHALLAEEDRSRRA